EVVPTVPTVRWTAPDVEDAEIVVEPDGGEPWSVAVDTDTPDGAFTTMVLGLKAAHAYTLTVQARTTDGVRSSEPLALTTGPPPTELPRITVEATDPDAMHRGYVITGLLNPPAAVILDSDGDYVWWYQPATLSGVVRTIVSHDGQSILLGGVNLDFAESAPILRVRYDGLELGTLDIPHRHHDFTELPDGTVAALTDDGRTVEGVEVRGDRLVELSPDGTLRTVYSVWTDHEFSPEDAGWTGPGGIIGWPHANYVEYRAADDSYNVSFLHLDGIAHIDRGTGEQRWFLGGADSTLTDAEGSAAFFDGQHGLQQLDDSLIVFVNGAGATDSRAVEVSIDPEAGRATPTWSYWPDPSLGSPVLGDVHRFDDGNTLVTFSFAGEIHEVTPDGVPIWTLSSELGGALSFVRFAERLQP
ncbi:MAG: hypothetical protein D6798_09630, partial [Deltaproteobacteria bacterium]